MAKGNSRATVGRRQQEDVYREGAKAAKERRGKMGLGGRKLRPSERGTPNGKMDWNQGFALGKPLKPDQTRCTHAVRTFSLPLAGTR